MREFQSGCPLTLALSHVGERGWIWRGHRLRFPLSHGPSPVQALEPSPTEGRGDWRPSAPRASPAFASLRVLPSGAWALRKGRVRSPSGKEGGCVVCFLGLVVFMCWVLGLGARIKVNEGCLFGKLEKVIFHENDYQLDRFA